MTFEDDVNVGDVFIGWDCVRDEPGQRFMKIQPVRDVGTHYVPGVKWNCVNLHNGKVACYRGKIHRVESITYRIWD